MSVPFTELHRQLLELAGERIRGVPEPPQSTGRYQPEERYQIEKYATIAFHKEFHHKPHIVWLQCPEHMRCVRGEFFQLPDKIRGDVRGAKRSTDFKTLYLCERPLYDKNHNPTGAAILWPNGKQEYRWQGRGVDPWIVLRPHRVCIKHIKREDNAELKRILIEKYIHHKGHAAFLQGMNAELIHEGKKGRLWGIRDGGRARFIGLSVFGGPRVEPDYTYTIAEVLNSTPEPDGSIKTYYLNCPPNMKTIDQALAWTFELEEDQYLLTHET